MLNAFSGGGPCNLIQRRMSTLLHDGKLLGPGLLPRMSLLQKWSLNGVSVVYACGHLKGCLVRLHVPLHRQNARDPIPPKFCAELNAVVCALAVGNS